MPATTRVPDTAGRFGQFGGRYTPETLTRALDELTSQYTRAAADPAFQAELNDLYKHYVGRPSPLYFARRLTQQCGGAKIYLKREDLNHTGSHKINNTLGQALLAVRMGKRRVIAETGTGQHGVATATACTLRPAVRRLHGRGRHPPPAPERLQHEASRCGSSTGDERFADLARCRERGFPRLDEQRRIDPFLRWLGHRAASVPAGRSRLPVDHRPRNPGSEPGATRPPARRRRGLRRWRQQRGGHVLSVHRGRRGGTRGRRGRWTIQRPGDHAATLSFGRPGVLHGAFSYVLQDEDGQTADVHSVSAGLDYPGTGPEHSYWKDTGRVRYTFARDDEIMDAFDALARLEGILPALESSHALCRALEIAAARKADDVVVVCLSGRGDKDAAEIARLRGLEF